MTSIYIYIACFAPEWLLYIACPEKHPAAHHSAFKLQAKCSHCGLGRSATVRKVAVKIQAKRCLCGPKSVRKDLQPSESSQPLLRKEGEGKTEVLSVSDLFQTSFRIALDLKGLDKIESQSQKRKKKESQRKKVRESHETEDASA